MQTVHQCDQEALLKVIEAQMNTTVRWTPLEAFTLLSLQKKSEDENIIHCCFLATYTNQNGHCISVLSKRK